MWLHLKEIFFLDLYRSKKCRNKEIKFEMEKDVGMAHKTVYKQGWGDIKVKINTKPYLYILLHCRYFLSVIKM